MHSKEIEQRHANIQQFLEAQGIGGLFAYSPPMEHKWFQTGHVGYLTGWANHDRIVDSAVVIPARGQSVLLLAGMEYMLEQIADVCPIKNVRLVQAVDPNAVASVHAKPGGNTSGTGGFAGEALSILSSNGLLDRGIGLVGTEAMPKPLYDELVAGFGSRLKPVEDIVARLRSIKSAAEVAAMKQASRLSDLGFNTMVRVAKPGLRGIEVVAEMERAVRREGADHAKYWMASGPAPDWNQVRLDIKPHERVLQDGDLMASCSYVVYKGYWCHGHRTGTLRRPVEELNRIYGICRDAQDRALEMIKPGVQVRHVAETIRAAVKPYGFDLLGGRIGHGMGMDYSEQPVPLNHGNDSELKAGMTFVVHPVYALPNSNKMFVPLGDVCHLTSEGPELLMQFSRHLFLAGD